MNAVMSTIPPGVYELYMAVLGLDVLRVKQLINAGTDVNYTWQRGDDPSVSNGIGPLVEAVSLSHHEIVKMLIEAGACVNTPDTFGTTPLHIACCRESLEIVSTLIKAGAEVNARDWLMRTPMLACITCRCLQNNTGIIQMLLKAGASMSIPNEYGLIPLHFAALYGLPDLTDMFVKANADVDCLDKTLMTPLCRAAKVIACKSYMNEDEHLTKLLQVIKILVLAGCDTLNLASFLDGMHMKEILYQKDPDLHSWFQKSRPESLKHLSRCAIKNYFRTLGVFELSKETLLPLPVRLKEYVSRELIY